jgi:hypothetical protein
MVETIEGLTSVDGTLHPMLKPSLMRMPCNADTAPLVRSCRPLRVCARGSPEVTMRSAST